MNGSTSGSGLCRQQPIGIFDSGVGGLSVAREIGQRLPCERLLYYADCLRTPWGVRPPEEVRKLAEGITAWLLHRGAKLIVVACNTASIHALSHLRGTFPHVRFVGIVPAVKPAARMTRTGRIGVLVTAASARGQALADLLDQFVHPLGVEARIAVPHGLVEQVERGQLAAPETRRILFECLAPLLEENVDTLALGCTHYPFVADLIGEVTGGRMQLINPAPAVAAQCARVLEETGLTGEGPERVFPEQLEIVTSGPADEVEETVRAILKAPVRVAHEDALERARAGAED